MTNGVLKTMVMLNTQVKKYRRYNHCACQSYYNSKMSFTLCIYLRMMEIRRMQPMNIKVYSTALLL